MLNWRRDPGYEHRKMLHEQRMKQLESELLHLESEILQLDRENAKLESLLSCVDRLCFPPESSSNPPPSIESNFGSSWR